MAALDEKVDVVIVGSGPSGSVMAALLAEAGKSVRVLESGPERPAASLYSSQIWARRLYWSVPHVEDANHSVHLPAGAGSGIGGTAMHHSALWPRFSVDDFKRRTLYGEGLDWPITYDDLKPFYDEVQKDVGLSGDAQAEIWRPPGAPYPLPPIQTYRQSEVLAEGFSKLDMQVSPAPVAILSRPYGNRPACTNDGWCLAGCPIGALANPLVTYIPRARKAGAVFSPGCHVTRVITDGGGRRATGVEYAGADGERRIQNAEQVVLAAFTAENVRILLNSATDRHPQGLGNSSGLVGRYIMTHAATNIYGLFDEDLHSYMGISTGNLYSQDRLPQFRANAGRNGARHWHVGPAMKPNDLFGVMMSRVDLFGDDLAQFMRRAARSLSVLIGACENVPLAENRIELSDKQDERDMPRARIVYKHTPMGEKLSAEVKQEGIAITKAAGAREAWAGMTVSHHLLGGTIMGNDPKQSVTDSYGRAHDLDNLYLCGPNLFPSISHANPTFTLHALAMRTARQFVSRSG